MRKVFTIQSIKIFALKINLLYDILKKHNYRTWEIFGRGKIGEFGKLSAFTEIFLANIHRYTENVFIICTNCSLFTKFVLANSFYLYSLLKFPPANISCAWYIVWARPTAIARDFAKIFRFLSWLLSSIKQDLDYNCSFGLHYIVTQIGIDCGF